MKAKIHPEYEEVEVSCACGHSFTTRSTKNELRLEICSACHPFFTGKQKLVDSGGRVERFRKRYAKAGVDTELSKQAKTTPAEDETSADSEA